MSTPKKRPAPTTPIGDRRDRRCVYIGFCEDRGRETCARCIKWREAPEAAPGFVIG